MGRGKRGPEGRRRGRSTCWQAAQRPGPGSRGLRRRQLTAGASGGRRSRGPTEPSWRACGPGRGGGVWPCRTRVLAPVGGTSATRFPVVTGPGRGCGPVSGPGRKPSGGPGPPWGRLQLGRGWEGRGAGPSGQELGGQWDQRVLADGGSWAERWAPASPRIPLRAPCPPLELGALRPGRASVSRWSAPWRSLPGPEGGAEAGVSLPLHLPV